MSADFFSFVAWMKPAIARRLFDEIRNSKCVLEDVVDPDGSPVFDPSGGETFKPRSIASLFRGKAPEPEDLATAYVDVDAAFLERFGKSSRLVMSPNSPAVVLVDRVLAIPYGLSFMRGQAVARFRSKGVARLAVEWPALLERVGGAKKAASKMAKYLDRWGNGYADASKMLAAMSYGIQTAAERERDLLVVGMVVP